MPRHFESPRPKAGSDTSTEAHPQAASSAAQTGQFTESQQRKGTCDGAASSHARVGGPGPKDISSEAMDPEDIWAPFPPSLFRVPVPNRLFEEMPSLTDSALRCLLALIRLSFRFDPEEGQWVRSGEAFRRAAVQEACGLSDEGARQGLTELETEGWARASRDGKAHEHRLSTEVPERRFTYVPTALLEEVGDMPTGSLPSGTALRVALAVLHRTWGWARSAEEVDSDRILSSERPQDVQGGPPSVHRRWARLSTSDLSRLTGRSESAVKSALSKLDGSPESGWIGRCRPDRGAYLYRFSGGDLVGSSTGKRAGVEKASSDGIANDLAPGDGGNRQRSGPPTSYGESISRDKHARDEAETTAEEDSHPGAGPTESGDAVRGDTPSGEDSPIQAERDDSGENSGGCPPDFSGFSGEKRELGRKLVNAGVWPERAKECLRRYSTARIEANFELYRERKNSSEAPRPEDDGAWLCAAITDGYASNSYRSDSHKSNSYPTRSQAGGPEAPSGPAGSGPTASPEHKQKISPREKATLIQKDLASEKDFHRFRHGDSPTEKQFLYFDPEIGGPGGPGR